jgi:hypothetical protein
LRHFSENHENVSVIMTVLKEDESSYDAVNTIRSRDFNAALPVAR